MTTATHTCDRCRSPLEAGDLRCATCGEVVLQEGASAPAAKIEVEVFRCTSCDAAARYDPTARAVRCAFCGAEMEHERIHDPVEQTRAYLPFTLDAADAQRALRTWLASLGWFRPSDLKSEARVDSLRPLWWVAWVFDAHATVSWTADSNAGSGRSEWAPHAGISRLQFDDILVSASRGLSDEETEELSASYDLATQRDEPAGAELGGATIEEFDVQRSQARARVMRAIDQVAAREVEARLCPGSRHRNVNVKGLLRELDTRRLAFPAWVLAYRYGNELFRVVISGQDARCIRGRAPVSGLKILLLVGLVVLIVLAVIALVAMGS